jgi:hypothetical protein
METVLSFKLCRTETYFKCVLENDIYESLSSPKKKKYRFIKMVYRLELVKKTTLPFLQVINELILDH